MSVASPSLLDGAVCRFVNIDTTRSKLSAASADDIATLNALATDLQSQITDLQSQADALSALITALTTTVAGKEDVANKSTDGTMAANSDTLYPSQKAAKTYADTKQAALGYTPEDAANKDTDGTLAANSDTKYASQKAAKTYADTKLSLAGGTMTGDIVLKANSSTTGSSGMDVFNSDDTGYQRFGFNGGNGPLFQLYGNSNGLAGDVYFDTYGGGMYFRWGPGTACALVFPGGTNIPELTGWDVGTTPADTTNATEWLKITRDGNTRLIPLHAP